MTKDPTTIIDLRTKHIDAFYAALPTDAHVGELFGDLLKNGSLLVRAAKAAGWFKEDPGDIGELTPGATLKLAQDIAVVYGKSLAISPS